MNNPYQPPQTAPVAQARSGLARRITVRVVSGLICALCVLQFLGIWLQVLLLIKQFGLAATMPTLVQMGMPSSLMLAGVFLVFRRKLSAVFFGLYLAQYLVVFVRQDAMASVSHIFLSVGFLAYALWLWKAGELQGWPTRSVKRPGTVT